MDFSLFIQGIIIGLTLAVPVGPIALICIQRTVTDGRFHGIFSGIGVATADSFYAAVTVLGLTIISSVIVTNQFLFRFLAGIVLIFVGMRVFMSLPSCVSSKTVHETYFKDYLSMVGIAIANPLTLVFFLIVLPGFGIVINSTAFLSAAEFIAGVFFGSTAWWILLCGTIGSMRSRFSIKTLRLINRVSGVLISVCGAGMLVLLAMTMGQ
ncbi:MAG TPA: LysE family transporter [Methanoregula sp.]|nr:LysE family transporter [Methanoregula sp.]